MRGAHRAQRCVLLQPHRRVDRGRRGRLRIARIAQRCVPRQPHRRVDRSCRGRLCGARIAQPATRSRIYISSIWRLHVRTVFFWIRFQPNSSAAAKFWKWHPVVCLALWQVMRCVCVCWHMGSNRRWRVLRTENARRVCGSSACQALANLAASLKLDTNLTRVRCPDTAREDSAERAAADSYAATVAAGSRRDTRALAGSSTLVNVLKKMSETQSRHGA